MNIAKIANRQISTGFNGIVPYIKASPLPMGTTFSGGAITGNGFRNFLYGLLPGAKVDYQAKAGAKWFNGIVCCALSWISRNIPYSPIKVYEEVEGQDKIVKDHPLEQLLKYPNKFYDGKTLLQATFLSLVAGGGNAFWWVKRNNAGIPMEFWWLPHFDVTPLWSEASTTDNWIEGYAYRNNGLTHRLKYEEILHFRDGLDPSMPRMGMDMLKAVCRELVLDNEASGYAAQLLDNMCIPGIIISPTGDTQLDSNDVNNIAAGLNEKTKGDNRFSTIGMSTGIKIDRMAFSPTEMSLGTMQDRPEARICSAIGIHPVVLGLTIGLNASKFDNMESAQKSSWYNCIMPRMMLICSEIDTQILNCYPKSSRQFCMADYKKVPALQDDRIKMIQSMTLAVGGPWMTPNEARSTDNKPPHPMGDILYPVSGAGSASDQVDEDGNQIGMPSKPISKNGTSASVGKN